MNCLLGRHFVPPRQLISSPLMTHLIMNLEINELFYFNQVLTWTLVEIMGANHGIFLLDPGQPLVIIRAAARCMSFPVSLQSGNGSVALAARVTHVGLLAVVHVGVELHVHPLGVVPAAGRAAVGLFTSVEPEVSLQVGGGAEPLSTHLAFMRLLT